MRYLALSLTTAIGLLFARIGFAQSNYSLEERVVRLELTASNNSSEIAMLRTLTSDQRDTMNRIVGIGIGLSALLMLLQIFQLLSSRTPQIPPPTARRPRGIA